MAPRSALYGSLSYTARKFPAIPAMLYALESSLQIHGDTDATARFAARFEDAIRNVANEILDGDSAAAAADAAGGSTDQLLRPGAEALSVLLGALCAGDEPLTDKGNARMGKSATALLADDDVVSLDPIVFSKLLATRQCDEMDLAPVLQAIDRYVKHRSQPSEPAAAGEDDQKSDVDPSSVAASLGHFDECRPFLCRVAGLNLRVADAEAFNSMGFEETRSHLDSASVTFSKMFTLARHAEAGQGIGQAPEGYVFAARPRGKPLPPSKAILSVAGTDTEHEVSLFHQGHARLAAYVLDSACREGCRTRQALDSAYEGFSLTDWDVTLVEKASGVRVEFLDRVAPLLQPVWEQNPPPVELELVASRKPAPPAAGDAPIANGIRYSLSFSGGRPWTNPTRPGSVNTFEVLQDPTNLSRYALAANGDPSDDFRWIQCDFDEPRRVAAVTVAGVFGEPSSQPNGWDGKRGTAYLSGRVLQRQRLPGEEEPAAVAASPPAASSSAEQQELEWVNVLTLPRVGAKQLPSRAPKLCVLEIPDEHRRVRAQRWRIRPTESGRHVGLSVLVFEEVIQES